MTRYWSIRNGIEHVTFQLWDYSLLISKTHSNISINNTSWVMLNFSIAHFRYTHSRSQAAMVIHRSRRISMSSDAHLVGVERHSNTHQSGSVGWRPDLISFLCKGCYGLPFWVDCWHCFYHVFPPHAVRPHACCTLTVLFSASLEIDAPLQSSIFFQIKKPLNTALRQFWSIIYLDL